MGKVSRENNILNTTGIYVFIFSFSEKPNHPLAKIDSVY